MVGDRKGHAFYDDLWTLKYLAKFRWEHLTEQLAYERAVRDQRLRTEIRQAKKTTQFYLQQAEKSKQIRSIEEKRRAKKDLILDTATQQAEASSKPRRAFRQRKPIEHEEVDWRSLQQS